MEDQEAVDLAAAALAVAEALAAADSAADTDTADLADRTITDIITDTIIITARDFSSLDPDTITTAADITAEAVLARHSAHFWLPSSFFLWFLCLPSASLATR